MRQIASYGLLPFYTVIAELDLFSGMAVPFGRLASNEFAARRKEAPLCAPGFPALLFPAVLRVQRIVRGSPFDGGIVHVQRASALVARNVPQAQQDHIGIEQHASIIDR